MNLSKPYLLFACSAIILTASGCNPSKQNNENELSQSKQPNILFILIDDLGYHDLSCYGSEFYETPNIDKLAEQGVKFVNAYTTSAVCSPTRASILTGKHPARLHITDWSGPEEWHPDGPLETPEFVENLPHEEYTIAEALKDNGYATCFLGKWHLGPPSHHPDKHGFDISLGATNAGAPPSFFYPYKRDNWEGTGWPKQITDLAQTGKEGEYLTDRLTDEAINFIDTVKDPFFLYLSHYAVHAPLESKFEKAEKYRKKAAAMYEDTINITTEEKNNTTVRIQQSHGVYGGMVESVDESVGRLMAALEEKGLDKNTIVIFTSDNGGYSASNFPLPGQPKDISSLPTSVAPLRAGKGWYYEGGIKIPSMIYWPGVTKPGTEITERVTSTDFYPTLMEMTGSTLKQEQPFDGISFVPALKGEKLNRDKMYWHFPHYHNSGQYPASAIRKGDFKLIYTYDDEKYELYNLADDPSEKNDLSEEEPEKLTELAQLLDKWLKETGAALPEK
jgi:arylsulfatase A